MKFYSLLYKSKLNNLYNNNFNNNFKLYFFFDLYIKKKINLLLNLFSLIIIKIKFFYYNKKLFKFFIIPLFNVINYIRFLNLLYFDLKININLYYIFILIYIKLFFNIFNIFIKIYFILKIFYNIKFFILYLKYLIKKNIFFLKIINQLFNYIYVKNYNIYSIKFIIKGVFNNKFKKTSKNIIVFNNISFLNLKLNILYLKDKLYTYKGLFGLKLFLILL